MTNMTGGTDLILETAKLGFDIRLILDELLEIWPKAMFQDADQEAGIPLVVAIQTLERSETMEFFVYKDKESAESWAEMGWSEEHGNDMVQFLVADNPSQPDKIQLTLVIDSIVGDILDLIKIVSDKVDRISERSSRINWEAGLLAVGYTSGRDRFYEQVAKFRDELFRGWSADELACHPHEALQFCEAVQKQLGPIPHHFVMKALMNHRRLGTKSK